MIKVGFIEIVIFGQRPKRGEVVSLGKSSKRAFHIKGTARSKTLKWEPSWSVQEASGSPGWLEFSMWSENNRRWDGEMGRGNEKGEAENCGEGHLSNKHLNQSI